MLSFKPFRKNKRNKLALQRKRDTLGKSDFLAAEKLKKKKRRKLRRRAKVKHNRSVKFFFN